MMQQIEYQHYKGERSLFASKGLRLKDCVFSDGESPLKESADLVLDNCLFRWKYPLWYCDNVSLFNCSLFEMARAGIWYTSGISVSDTVIQAPKAFRRCSGVTLSSVYFSDAKETLWNCDGVRMDNVSAKGDYFAMNCADMTVDSLKLDGNYSFDGCRNVIVKNSHLLSKDAFWNCENVTVYGSFISGEYLGWNSKNVTFVDCTIESLQGLCCIDGLKMENCRLINTDLAFEHSTVDADIKSGIVSVFNPAEGVIKAESIGELIIESDKTDISKIKIDCTDVKKRSDRPEWLR